MILVAFIDLTLQVPSTPRKKPISEIPTPCFVVVDTYERDYTRTFKQTPSYVRSRGGLFPVNHTPWDLMIISLPLLTIE